MHVHGMRVVHLNRCVAGFLKLFEPLSRMSKAKDKSQKARGVCVCTACACCMCTARVLMCICALHVHVHVCTACASACVHSICALHARCVCTACRSYTLNPCALHVGHTLNALHMHMHTHEHAHAHADHAQMQTIMMLIGIIGSLPPAFALFEFEFKCKAKVARAYDEAFGPRAYGQIVPRAAPLLGI